MPGWLNSGTWCHADFFWTAADAAAAATKRRRCWMPLNPGAVCLDALLSCQLGWASRLLLLAASGGVHTFPHGPFAKPACRCSSFPR